ncbi:MAG: hypothetical protein VYE22_02780 [Myxococcota bacterium]|nr:hypothetical protein [Myxococcota bacterium]
MAPNLDVPAVAKAYEARGLAKETFYHHLDELLRVRSLAVPGLDWTLLDHMLSSVQSLRLREHFEAFAEGAGLRYRGLIPFLEAAVAAGFFPETALRRTELQPASDGTGDFGRLLRKLGLASKEQIADAADIQARIASEVGVEPAIGCVLRSTAGLSVVDFIRALAVFRGIEGDDLDQLADDVYDATTRRTTMTMRTRTRG